MADVVTLKSVTNPPPDPGELKHAVVDENRGDLTERPLDTVEEVRQKGADWTADSAYEYLAEATATLSSELRRRMEDQVRKLKLESKPCVHCSGKKICSKLLIRCGDRRQYAARETGAQRLLPHQCRYEPGTPGNYVLVVDKDESVREFCRDTLVLFLGRSRGEVLTAATGEEAVSTLTQCKIEGRRCGLVLSDVGLGGMTGYDLVNDLYRRNYTMPVALMKDPADTTPEPEEYLGRSESAPGRTFAGAPISKPFHSDELLARLKSMGLVKQS